MANLARQIEYWQKSAERDYETMVGLFQIKRHSESLFFGHIILEKILKAHVVMITRKEAPRIHNLVILASIADLELSNEEKEFLAVVNRYNMRTRYPDIRLNFYRLCTREYTEKNLKKIKALYQKLCQRMKQNK